MELSRLEREDSESSVYESSAGEGRLAGVVEVGFGETDAGRWIGEGLERDIVSLGGCWFWRIGKGLKFVKSTGGG